MRRLEKYVKARIQRTNSGLSRSLLDVQTQPADTGTRVPATTAGNHDSTPSTSIEQWTLEDYADQTPPNQVKGNGLVPVTDGRISEVELPNPAAQFPEQEIGPSEMIVESPGPGPVGHPSALTQPEPGRQDAGPARSDTQNDDRLLSEPQIQHPSPPPIEDASQNLSDLLWDEAYDQVKVEHTDMAMWYEQTLSTRLEQIAEKVITPQTSTSFNPFEIRVSQENPQDRRIQMKELLESLLNEADHKDKGGSEEDDDDGEGETETTTVRKMLQHAVDSTMPNALLAWVGICFASKILLSPKASNKDDFFGLLHVISRMDWYGRLPRLLPHGGLKLNEPQSRLRARILELYKAILSFEMNIVCCHSGTLAFSFPASIDRSQEPKPISLKTIANAEEALPLFSQELVLLPFKKQILQFAEKTSRRQDDPTLEARSESSESAEGSSEDDAEVLNDLHVDRPKLKTLPSVKESQRMRCLHSMIDTRREYLDFREWEKADSTLLWIRGSPGQGKTMLLKSIIQAISGAERRDSTAQCIAFFFFDYRNPGANNPAAALRHLLWSLLTRQPTLVKHLKSKRSTTGRTTFDDPGDFFALSGVLHDMIKDEDFLETYLIIDALDECSSEDGQPSLVDFLRLIQELTQQPTRARWLVSSNVSSVIQSALRQGSHIAIDPSLPGCSDAIRSYIETRVGELAKAKAYDDELAGVIVATLDVQASGNYLWVNAVCDALKAEEKWYAESVLDEVKDFNGLDPLYEHLMGKLESLPRNDWKFCLEILGTMATANQSLHLSELEELVLLEPRVNLRNIVEKCSCFLDIALDGTVSFHHQTARDYVREKIPTASRSHAELTHRGINSLIKIFANRTLGVRALATSSFLSLYWINHLYEMVREVAVGDEGGDNIELFTEASKGVVLFLKEHFLSWFEALNLENQLEKAAILLQKVDLLLNAKVDEIDELGVAIRDAHLIFRLHLSAETPKNVPAANTLLFCPTESILSRKYLREAFPWMNGPPLGNPRWGRDFAWLKGHTDWVRCVAFCPGGRLIASGSDDGSDSFTGQKLHNLKKNGGNVRAIAYSPDGTYLAAASARTLRIWDLSAKPAQSIEIEEHDDFINSVSFSCDGKLLATGSDDGRIRIWDSWQEGESRKAARILKGHTEEVSSIAFSPQTRPGFLASGSVDGTSKIWNLEREEDECIHTLKSEDTVNSISFSPDGLRLASGANNDTIDIWDTVSGDQLERMRANGFNVRSVTFSPTGTYLASASHQHRVHFWYTANKNAAFTNPPRVLKSVVELAVAPDRQTVATGHPDGKVMLWNINSKDLLPTETGLGHGKYVHCLAFSPDGTSLASGSSDYTVRVCDVATGEEREVLEEHEDWIRSVAWSPDGAYLASGSDDNSVCVYKLDGESKSWAVEQTLTYNNGVNNDSDASVDSDAEEYVRAVAFSPDKVVPRLVGGGDSGTVVVWKREKGKWKIEHAIDAHEDYIRSVAFTPDATRIVTAADDYTLRIWNTEKRDFVGETITTRAVLDRMRFEASLEQSGYALTPVGAQPLDPSVGDADLPDWCPYGIRRESHGGTTTHWLTWKGHNIIFFPRGFLPKATYILGNKIIVGTELGMVLVFEFAYGETPKLLGRGRRDTLASIRNLRDVHCGQGRHDHPSTLTGKNNLARVLQSQGGYKEAEGMYREQLGLREKALGGDHPSTLASMSNLASVLDSEGRYDEAEAIYRKALALYREVLGEEHPSTLDIMGSLASVLSIQGKYAEAEAMHGEVLELYGKTLGRAHRSTLVSMSNLAGVLSCQGKYDEAEAMYREVLELYEEELGRDHPSTLSSLTDLASVLDSQGRHDEAEEVREERKERLA
ncbi:uncharacterized protein DNG_06154 [Cephalotrichum gorgonifer]|uniref:NACHT domain-containing protein n=1 Tax=Cephalotrichum gorgonifer TaxID=2041049 RepID=A0AAE8MZ39_9PEZI|nr:uncharacterized protein DNG_06154 [Cephalotrichum gorgonifer]